MYSVLGNDIYFFAKKKSLSPRIVIFQHSNVRNLPASTVYTVYSLPSYEINIMIYHISYFCRMVDHWLMVDRLKIETNLAHNFFCSLAPTDFNSHLILTVVDEKNWTVLLLQQYWKISDAVYRLHKMSLRYRYRGEKWRFGSFIHNYNIICRYQEKENYAVIMHSHFSEFNDNAGTLSHVIVDNSPCITKNLRQNLKVTTFLRAVCYHSVLSMTMMYQLGKATE